MTDYRAAYWVDDETGAEIRLTAEEHAEWTDEDLITEGTRFAALLEIDLTTGKIVIA